MTPVKGDYFRVLGPTGIGPEVWTWDGECDKTTKALGYKCRRLIDDFRLTLYTRQMVRLPELKEL